MMYNRYFLLTRGSQVEATLRAALATALSGEASGSNQVSINDVRAINANQALVTFNIVSPLDSMMNQGNLRTYAAKIAADFAAASGAAFAVESAAAYNNEINISMIANI